MNIFLSFPGGILNIDIEPSDVIGGIKTKIVLDLPQYSNIEKIKLFYNNQLLDDTTTLSENFITRNNTITMTYDEELALEKSNLNWITIFLLVPILLMLFFTKR